MAHGGPPIRKVSLMKFWTFNVRIYEYKLK